MGRLAHYELIACEKSILHPFFLSLLDLAGNEDALSKEGLRSHEQIRLRRGIYDKTQLRNLCLSIAGCVLDS